MESEPAASSGAMATKTAHQEPKLDPHQGSGHADQHQTEQLVAPEPARRCQNPSSASQETADDRELARVQRGNYRQDTPEQAQDHKSSCDGGTNPARALRGEEGTFPRGKGYLLAGPGSIPPNGVWLGSDRIPGLNSPPDLCQAPNSCGLAGVDGM